jgi:hypothetical protein
MPEKIRDVMNPEFKANMPKMFHRRDRMGLFKV